MLFRSQSGVFDKAVHAIEQLVARRFRVNINCTLFNDLNPGEVAKFFDYVTDLGVEGITVSPGYSYEHAPRQDAFLGRRQTKRLFREIFALGRSRSTRWHFNHSSLYLEFLAGNQTYACTPWSNPTYNVFGWQKPCYLLVDEGYADNFADLMATTEWGNYGTGRNPKCNNCMAHCGYEGTAVEHTVTNPLAALKAWLFGPHTSGPMAPELPLVEVPTSSTDVEIPVDQLTRSGAMGKN